MKARLKFRHRVERQWAEQIRSLMQIHRQMVVAAERTLQCGFNHDGSLIPVPARVVKRRLSDRARSHD
jgi:hypothetical protein